MIDPRTSDEERRVQRWGGLAGLTGGVLFLFVFFFVGAIVGPDPAGPGGAVTRFPEIRAARTLENTMYLVVLILWATHFLALYRALRAKLAPALFGTVLGMVGLVVLAAGALPHVATAPISDLYHAPGASPEDQTTLVLLWQATQGILNELLVVGLVVLPISLIPLGGAMLGIPAFGRGFGGLTMALGLIGVGAAAVLLVDPRSFIAVIGFFALIVFHLVLGLKVHSLSRGPAWSEDRDYRVEGPASA